MKLECTFLMPMRILSASARMTVANASVRALVIVWVMVLVVGRWRSVVASCNVCLHT